MAERFDVTVVGAGPAGIAAAVTAAEAGAKVALIDESERSGGQIWREDRGEIPVRARPWFTRLNKSSVTWLDSTSILDAHAPGFLETTRGPVESDRLVLATGARELFLPFPGWTLPGVTGAGGLQALVHEGLDVAGEKIVLAGTGPLLLQVASHLNHRGAKVIRVAEQAPLLRLLSFGLALEGPKRKQAFDLRNFRLRTSTWPSAALGKDRLEAVVLRAPYGEQTLACDRLGVGFSLVPNLELARRLGCACDEQGVTVGLDQATSVEGVFAAGEVCGVKGVAGALHDGICAGTAAAGQEVSTRMQYLRDIERSFGRRMAKAFELRDELKSMVTAETILCRCEDVRAGEVARATSWNEAKLHTRCGMGSCQGRVCGAATNHLFGWGPTTVRPPLVPIPIENLMNPRSAS